MGHDSERNPNQGRAEGVSGNVHALPVLQPSLYGRSRAVLRPWPDWEGRRGSVSGLPSRRTQEAGDLESRGMDGLRSLCRRWCESFRRRGTAARTKGTEVPEASATDEACFSVLLFSFNDDDAFSEEGRIFSRTPQAGLVPTGRSQGTRCRTKQEDEGQASEVMLRRGGSNYGKDSACHSRSTSRLAGQGRGGTNPPSGSVPSQQTGGRTSCLRPWRSHRGRQVRPLPS